MAGGTQAPKPPDDQAPAELTAEQKIAALQAELDAANKERDDLEAENNALRDANADAAEAPTSTKGVLTANAAGKIVGDHAKGKAAAEDEAPATEEDAEK